MPKRTGARSSKYTPSCITYPTDSVFGVFGVCLSRLCCWPETGDGPLDFTSLGITWSVDWDLGGRLTGRSCLSVSLAGCSAWAMYGPVDVRTEQS